MQIRLANPLPVNKVSKAAPQEVTEHRNNVYYEHVIYLTVPEVEVVCDQHPDAQA
jgi:hypothetical protein